MLGKTGEFCFQSLESAQKDFPSPRGSRTFRPPPAGLPVIVLMNRWLPILTALLLCVPWRASAEPDGCVDDAALLKTLTRQVQQLQEQKKLVPIKELREQLVRTRVALKLAAPGAQPLAPAELYRRVQGSVLIHCHLFNCSKCKRVHVNPSTCFPLTSDGICVANYHAFINSNTIAMAVASRDGRVFPVTEVLAASARDDIAIFRVAADNLQPLLLAAPAAVGEPIAVISHPHSAFYVMTQGAVARYCLEKGAPRMQITADYAIGSSGGPVLGANGAVVGMVASTQTIYADRQHGEPGNMQMVVKLCVPCNSIRKLIKE